MHPSGRRRHSSSEPGWTAPLAQQLASFRNYQLWAAYLTSGVMMGATYAAFSYITPIATELSGVSLAAIPLLLGAYGLGSFAGTLAVGRIADRHTYSVTLVGLIILAVALLAFALHPENTYLAIGSFLLIAISGASLSLALIARVMRVAEPGGLVNSFRVSIINSGLAFIAWVGASPSMPGADWHRPLWVGLMLAVLAVLTVLPQSVRRASTTI